MADKTVKSIVHWKPNIDQNLKVSKKFVKQTRDKQDIRGKNLMILELKKTTTNQMPSR